MISREIVDKILDAARIEEVVGDFVLLKKKGTNLWGNCPFHHEKTPSFAVSPAKGLYKCFGCAKGGNAVNFIMEHEQLTYPEALKYLAGKYQIEVEETAPDPEEQRKANFRESLFVVNAYAQRKFSDNLFNSEEGKATALTYLRERGFTDSIIEKFQLGYSMSKRSAFTSEALADGYHMDILTATGLTISNEHGQIDRFHSRVMFPIHGVSGKVVGFGGRTLSSEKKVAKYLNSPESEIYSKSNILYGLFFAKKQITGDDNCFLVEGYTDVISLHQAGITNVVASSGTSLTTEQIRLISRYTTNITILYDGDNAGIKASFRGIDMILQEGMNVRVLLFPEGDDPDSFARKHTAEEIRTFIKENSKDFISFKSELLLAEASGDPIAKSKLVREIIESVALVDDAFTRSLYIKECARRFDIQEQILISELNKIRRNKLKKAFDPEDGVEDIPLEIPSSPKQSDEVTFTSSEHQEKDIIRILLHYGDKDLDMSYENEDGEMVELKVNVASMIINDLVNDDIQFENPLFQNIFNEIRTTIDKGDLHDPSGFSRHHDPDINKTAGDMMISKHTLSENWKNYHIYVTTEDLVLKKSVFNSLYALKINRVMKAIEECQLKLKEVKTDEEMYSLLENIRDLQGIMRTISAALGRVVVK